MLLYESRTFFVFGCMQRVLGSATAILIDGRVQFRLLLIMPNLGKRNRP
jgi:hypothetical protein